MNAAATRLFAPDELSAFFQDLEDLQGGDGNGTAALWPEDGKVKVSKGITLTAAAAAKKVKSFAEQEAEWLLYHTRFATGGPKSSRNCHPFQHGKLTLAHNGHDFEIGHLGHSIGVTDSECLALLWARLSIPLEDLILVSGVFIGFFDGMPFVVKGESYSDLVVAVAEDCGAVLFASELPRVYRDHFDRVIEIGSPFVWDGQAALNLVAVPRRPRQVVTKVYKGKQSEAGVVVYSAPARQFTQPQKERITMDDLRAHFLSPQRKDEAPSDEQNALSPASPPADPAE